MTIDSASLSGTTWMNSERGSRKWEVATRGEPHPICRLETCNDGAVRKQAKRRSSNLRESFVGSTPTRVTETPHASVGHWQAQVAVTHPPSGFAGSTPARRNRIRFGPFVYRYRTRAPQAREAGSIPARVALAKWRNWKTHDAQNVGPSQGMGVRISPWSLFDAGGPVPSEAS